MYNRRKYITEKSFFEIYVLLSMRRPIITINLKDQVFIMIIQQ